MLGKYGCTASPQFSGDAEENQQVISSAYHLDLSAEESAELKTLG